VIEDFEAHGAIVEKYDVEKRRSDVAPGIRFGYSANQVGFGWTNAAVLDLLAGLGRKALPRAALAVSPARPRPPGKAPVAGLPRGAAAPPS